MTELRRPVLPDDPAAAARCCLQRPNLAAEPGVARSVAARARAWSTQLREVRRVISTGPDREVWAGQAARAFAAGLRGIVDDLSLTSERYAAYAVALEVYARELDGVLPALSRARERVGYELDRLRTAPGRALGIPQPTPPAAGPRAPLRLVCHAGVGSVGPAPSDAALRAAVAEFVTVFGHAVGAAERCAERLRAADRADPGRDRTGWRAFAHSLAGAARFVAPFAAVAVDPSAAKFSDALSVLGTELTMVGLGLLFICPPAGAACLLAAAVLSAAQLGVDSYRRFGQHDRRVGNFDLAMDLLGALPVGGAAVRGGRAAGTAGRAARAAARGGVLERGASILVDAARAGSRECHAGLTAEVRLLRGLPDNYFRAPLEKHGGVAGLARRWAPKMLDAAIVPFSWPVPASSSNLPNQQQSLRSARPAGVVGPGRTLAVTPGQPAPSSRVSRVGARRMSEISAMGRDFAVQGVRAAEVGYTLSR